MKKIVISGINLVEGGTLSIFRDNLRYLSKELANKFEIIALVNNKELFKDINNILFLEFPKAKKSYFNRMYYEYYYFNKLSKEIGVYLWFSIHDMSPNVVAEKKIVYCHNPMPFYKMTLREIKLAPKLYLFNLFYKYLYKINIKKNDYVIVQQNWIKERFKEMYKIDNVLVAYPEVKKEDFKINNIEIDTNKINLFYPSFPRVFKNFEVICETAQLLEKNKYDNFVFYLTIDGKMNKYAEYIVKKYGNIKNLKFIGRISRDQAFSYYNKVDALIFPSKLETWGLPITEFKQFDKTIFLADLPYAHETVGAYDKAIFFDPNIPNNLYIKLVDFMDKNIEYDNPSIKLKEEQNKILNSWHELFEKILNDGEKND